MIVRIVREGNYPDWFQQIPGNKNTWDGIEFTMDPIKECDLLVVCNRPNKYLFTKVPKGGKWLFSHEPPVEVYKWHRKSFRYFDRVFSFWENSGLKQVASIQTGLPWFIEKSYDELTALTIEKAMPDKKTAVSWVTSDAKEKPGHFLRLRFKEILEQESFDFSLFGRGFRPIKDKFDAIYPYKYSIAIENYSCNDYWTEKISDCFLSWTVPIYYGAKNILKYFPEQAMIRIDPNQPNKSIEIIKEAIQNDFFEKSIPYLQESRELVLNKYQLFPNITRLIKESNLDYSDKKWNFIPKNRFPMPLSTRIANFLKKK